jgi:hypothetical protein
MRFQIKAAVLAMAIVVAGCAAVPINNVNKAPTTNAAGKTLSREQVRAAIVRAGASLGWQMADEGSDKLVGTLSLRKHTAVVEIPYSTSNYSIIYRSSTGLGEQGGNIHKNYNGWIQNLNRGINAQLAAS